MKARFSLLGLAAALAFSAAPDRAEGAPVATEGLAQGEYARMGMLFEVTIFQIDVFRLSMQFDEPTREKLAALARGHRYSDSRAARIAEVAWRAENALVVTRFERDVDFDRFVNEARKNVRRAREAGMISAAAYRTVHEGLPAWFSAFRKRGFEEGDRLYYRLRPEGLRMVLLDERGRKLLDLQAEGAGARRTLLASYFAPGSDFRKPLIRSLFR